MPRTAVKRTLHVLFFALLATAIFGGTESDSPAPKGRVMTEISETKDLDPYRWMEDTESPRTQAWVKIQAERAERYFQSRPMRQKLRDEFRELFNTGSVSMPSPRGGKYFFWKREAGQDLSALYVKDGLDGEPRLLLDQNALSNDKSVRVASWAVTADGSLMAYGLTASGNDRNDLRVMDLATGKDLPDVIPAEYYPSFETWSSDKTGFWYTKHDPRASMSEAKLHQRLYFHRLGTDWHDDKIVFGEGFSKEASFGAGLSDDSRFLLVDVYGQDQASGKKWREFHVRDLKTKGAKFIRIIDREIDVEISASLRHDRVYITTDKDAPNFRLLSMDLKKAMVGDRRTKVVIPDGPYPIQQTRIIGKKLFVETLENVHSVLREYDLDGNYVDYVELPTLGTLGDISAERNGDEMFYSFESFAFPDAVYRYDLKTGRQTLVSQMDAGFDTDLIETRQVWFKSKDGTKVPMFVIHRRGLEFKSDNPCVLYGYGGFNISLTPSFMKGVIPFLRRGGVYAIANLRGGGEFGKDWHEAGMRERKQNVFDDFAAAAEWLVKTGYTRRNRLAVSGGSNGGLLTLVTATQRPELVKAVVSHVPVTDMLRFHLFNGGVYWIPDYGDPDDPEARRYLLAYSPYHNVRSGTRYPSILIATSDGDDRVHPMHSYKMAARLLKANASANPILLRVELKAGHGGAASVSKYVESAADEWSFIFDQLGVAE